MLFEVRGQVLHAELRFQLLPDGVDAFGVLVGADGQGGGEPVKAVVPGVLRRAAHPQPVADGAAAVRSLRNLPIWNIKLKLTRN